MADIEVNRAHDLGLAGARAAAEKMADQLARKFDLKGDWHGNVLKFERSGVSGTLSVLENELRLSVALGFLLKAMKPSIQKAVEEELDALLQKGALRKAQDERASHPPQPKKPATPRKKHD